MKAQHLHTKHNQKYPRWFSGLFLCTRAARFCFGNVFRNPQIHKPSRLDGLDPSIQHPHPELSMAETPMCVHKTESSPSRICSIPKQFPQHLSDSERKGEQCELLESTSQTPVPNPIERKILGGERWVPPVTGPVLLQNNYSWVKAKNINQQTKECCSESVFTPPANNLIKRPDTKDVCLG